MLISLFLLACASNGPTTAPPVASPPTEPETQSTEPEIPSAEAGVPSSPTAAIQAPPKEAELWTQPSFDRPESVLIDFKTSRLWVSNIVGQPADKDGVGHVLEFDLDGHLKSDRFTSGVTLNAPKGMCILDDSLYIADIDVVHVVSVHTGAFRYDVPIQGAVFLNDMACGFNEAYVSDSQNGRIHRIYKEGKAELVTDLSPRKPNGLAVQGISLFVADFGSDAVLRLSPSGSIEDQWTLPAGGLDGIAVLRDRSIVVSSWDGEAIYKMTSDGGIDTLADGIKSPADFAVDQRHNRLVVPQLTENQLRIIPMAWPGQAP